MHEQGANLAAFTFHSETKQKQRTLIITNQQDKADAGVVNITNCWIACALLNLV